MKRKIAINTPIGGIEYEWETALKDPNTKSDHISNVIESFLISIKSGISIQSKEIEQFLTLLRNYGHIAKFGKKDKENFEILIKFHSDIINNKKLQILNLVGIWKSVYPIRGIQHKVILRMIEDLGELTAEIDIEWDSQYHNSLTEKFKVSLDQGKVSLYGQEVKFMHRGDTNESSYNLDNFILKLNENKKQLDGCLIDVNGENKVTFEKVLLTDI